MMAVRAGAGRVTACEFVSALAEVAERIDAADAARAVIVFIVSDAGWKYLSTGVWTDDLDEATANVEGIVYF